MASTVRVRAFAKINLTLRVLGRRADGYHELRTTLQSLALHDTLTFTRSRDGFELACDDPACPTDDNLVEKAAHLLWRSSGRRGRAPGVRAQLRKRVPMQAGLGGGSSDAAATLRALSALWGLPDDPRRLAALGRELGADVPFLLEGGTMLGVDRGDLLFRLPDWPSAAIVLALPDFGVSTSEAYGWYDREARPTAVAGSMASAALPRGVRMGRGRDGELAVPGSELVNHLQAPVAARHPIIERLVAALRRAGASHAAMSGSGSAVFGLFDSPRAARSAAHRLGRAGYRALATRTLSRAAFRRQSAPRLR
jgi:4-diphosphocytidyl-2-C-methyl-D-erythritol kinase